MQNELADEFYQEQKKARYEEVAGLSNSERPGERFLKDLPLDISKYILQYHEGSQMDMQTTKDKLDTQNNKYTEILESHPKTQYSHVTHREHAHYSYTTAVPTGDQFLHIKENRNGLHHIFRKTNSSSWGEQTRIPDMPAQYVPKKRADGSNHPSEIVSVDHDFRYPPRGLREHWQDMYPWSKQAREKQMSMFGFM